MSCHSSTATIIHDHVIRTSCFALNMLKALIKKVHIVYQILKTGLPLDFNTNMFKGLLQMSIKHKSIGSISK